MKFLCLSMLAIFLTACGSGSSGGGANGFSDTTPPVFIEVTPVSTPSTDTTPSYTFHSNEAGTLTYSGTCTSTATFASEGNNTITFADLPVGTYSNCKINVTDSANNVTTFTVTAFTITEVDVTGPTIEMVAAIATVTNDTTPDITFSSNEAGIITYGGSCSSATTTAINGNNTITLNTLAVGTYSNCTVKVTDVAGNLSSDLVIADFTIDTTAPALSQITPVATPTYSATPSYTFHSTEVGTITYGGDCNSVTTSASSGNNTITFSYLDIGTYDNCTIKVTDLAGNFSIDLAVDSFVVFYGVVTTDLNSTNDEGKSIALQTDGKILVGGSSYGDTPNHFALVRYNPDGSLDASFNDDGIVTTNVNSLISYGYSIVVQTDGKILMIGSNYNGSGPFDGTYDIALVRFNSDGSLDTSFNDDGIVTTDVNFTLDVGYSVVMQSDDKILVVGRSTGDVTMSLVLVRYNSNGSLDTGFGINGILITNFGATESIGYSATVQSDGKILASGISHNGSDWDIFLVRYNIDGSLDVSFDDDGLVTTDLNSSDDYGYSVTLQSDGKILVAGDSGADDVWGFSLVRYNSDGSLDASFSGDGILKTNVGFADSGGRSVIVQSDNKILVVGASRNANDLDIALVRYNTDGSLDDSFNGDGIVTTDIGFKNNNAESVVLQPDGKIVVAGSSNNGTDWDFSVVRYNSDGSLDSTFHD
jgi:uncharacterized delta-60 repeat protein